MKVTSFESVWSYIDDLSRDDRDYWSLLLVSITLPRLCADRDVAEPPASGDDIVTWANRYVADGALSGAEVVQIEQAIFGVSRATTDNDIGWNCLLADGAGRYRGYSFVPGARAESGGHESVEGGVLNLDPVQFTNQLKNGVERWMAATGNSH